MECQNHKPQQTHDTKRKAKGTQSTAYTITNKMRKKQQGVYTDLLLGTVLTPETALSTNLLVSRKTAAKKLNRPTSKTSSQTMLSNTKNGQFSCRSKHFYQHEYCPTFVSTEALLSTWILASIAHFPCRSKHFCQHEYCPILPISRVTRNTFVNMNIGQ